MGDYISEYFDAQNTPSISLSVYQCGWQICGKNHSYGPAIRDHFVIHYITKGKGEYFVSGKTYKLKQGDGFLILPLESTSYCADSEDPWEYYWVGFNGSEAKKLLELSGLGNDNFIFSYTKDNRLEKHLSDLYYSSKEYSSREFAMIGYLYLFFSCIITENQIKRPIEEYLKRAVQYIEENYSYHVTVEDIAHYVGVERSYLYRIFINEFGSSVHDYIVNYKLSKAKEMLSAGKLSITEIAYSLSFQSSSHFSKIFKSIVGISPSKYRKAKLNFPL